MALRKSFNTKHRGGCKAAREWDGWGDGRREGRRCDNLWVPNHFLRVGHVYQGTLCALTRARHCSLSQQVQDLTGVGPNESLVLELADVRCGIIQHGNQGVKPGP
jgi:hypothetical protein